MKLISIVIPTYNESANIIPLIECIIKTFEPISFDFEIIIADDNSPDNTAAIVNSYIAKQHLDSKIKVINRLHNRGLGNSIKDGIIASKGDIIIGMDADFNHHPETIPLMLHQISTHQLVVASRFVTGGGMADSFRQLTSWLINMFFRLLGMPITDNTSGYYAIRKPDLIRLNLDRIYYGYGDYHLRLVGFAAKKGYSITEVPTYYHKRLGGTSKSSFIKMFFTYIGEVWRLRHFKS